MDPLSVIASTIAIIQAISKTYEILKKISDLPDAFEEVNRQLPIVEQTLKNARPRLGQGLDPSDKEEAVILAIIDSCQKKADKLKEIFATVQAKCQSEADSALSGKIRATYGKTLAGTKANQVESLMKDILKDTDRLASNKIFKLATTQDLTAIENAIENLARVGPSLFDLRIAEDAVFGCAVDQHEPECLSGTREDVLNGILKWVASPQETCLYWLKGMAGTGKSTISRTICKRLEREKLLGASFFFKRGEAYRGNGARLFTTLAHQLAVHSPAVKSSIKDALDADPSIPKMAFTEQFNRLILQPLSNSEIVPPKVVIVIDALDECEGESDIEAIIAVLAQAKEAKPTDLRIFLTSRPDLPLRLGFGKVSGRFQDCVLHEVPSIASDIPLYLRNQLSKIREQAEKHRGCSFPENWPGEEKIQELASAATPLFIAAATYCRFIADERSHPDDRLQIVCRDKGQHFERLDETYITVLKQLVNQDDPPNDRDYDSRDGSDDMSRKKIFTSDFRQIVGAIIILATPLSISSMAKLFSIEETKIRLTLNPLHSVLNIPQGDGLVRTFHLSFPDFLLSSNLKKSKFHRFWIDEKQVHREIASRCTDLMSKELKENICGLKSHGTLRSEISEELVDKHIPAEVQYACRYWTSHLVRSEECIVDDGQVHTFLQTHLLHWLEIMGLLGTAFEVIDMIVGLQSRVDRKNGENMTEFLYDIKRFVLQNQNLIDKAPLQTYSSAILFSPESSIVRVLFKLKWVQKLPESGTEKLLDRLNWSWIYKKSTGAKNIFKQKAKIESKVQGRWGALQQTLEGHSHGVNAVAFAPDGRTIASGSYDKNIKLWDAITGRLQQTLKGCSSGVSAVAFSPDGRTIASGSRDETIKLWDVTTGRLQQTLEGHISGVGTIAFSPNGRTIAYMSHGAIGLWDVTTGLQQTFEDSWVRTVAFSPDGRTIAYGSYSGAVGLWDVTTGLRQTFEDSGVSTVALSDFPTRRIQQILDERDNWVGAVAFSPDGRTIASGSYDKNIKLWDATTGRLQRTLKGHSSWVDTIAFSPDGRTIASGSYDKTIKLWDATTRRLQQTLKGHSSWVNAVAFSPDGRTIASGSDDKTIKLWDAIPRRLEQALKGHSSGVYTVAFSPDGRTIASGSRDKTIKLWDVTTGRLQQTLKGHSGDIVAVAFSPDGRTIASGSRDKTIKLWDVTTGRLQQTLQGHIGDVGAVAFSSDSRTIASGSDDDTIKLWDVTIGQLQQTLKGHSSGISAVAFSSDNRTIASKSDDKTIKLWDASTGRLQRTLEGHSSEVQTVAFSLDDRTIVSRSYNGTIKLWDATTGRLQHQNSNSWHISQNNYYEPMAIRVHDEWVMRGEENLLWLPDNYRATASAVYGPTVVLGSSYGFVTIIKFDFSSQTLT